MQQQRRTPPQHSTFSFMLRSETFGGVKEVIFDSNFDSGNCARVEQNGMLQYTVHTANDCAGTSYEGYPKSWFHFSVAGFPRCVVKFIVKNLNMLWPVSKQPELYRPVCRTEHGEWQRIERPVSIYTRENELEVHFEQQFEGEKMWFAFSYPYSYTEIQKKLKHLEASVCDDSIYFNREVLIHSPEKRNIDLVVITAQENVLTQRQTLIPNLFPESENYSRPLKFRHNKPIIFVSARVHPGETPSSHTMNGILDFLVNTTDARANLLRKYFIFYCLPMLNPDGVYNGHYRMDIFNQNLNRYYIDPDLQQQPSCYAIRKLCDSLSEEYKIVMYCDLHAHGGKKGCFFYGNAFDEFIYQVESQLLAKVLSLNCINFEYDYCNFSKKHMVVKDRNEERTKEGCGRVCFYKQYGVIHSYTLECGYHSSNYVTQLPFASNVHRKYQGLGFEEQDCERSTSEMYKKGPPFYTIEIYENIGKSFLISILDIFEKNPYSRIPNTQFKTIESLRKDVASQLQKLDRFRKEDGKLQTKVKKINELIQEYFYAEFVRRKTFVESRVVKSESKQKQTNLSQQLHARKEPNTRKFIIKKQPVQQQEDHKADTQQTQQTQPITATLNFPNHTILLNQKFMHQPSSKLELLPPTNEMQGRKLSPHVKTEEKKQKNSIANSRLNQKFQLTKKDIRFPEIQIEDLKPKQPRLSIMTYDKSLKK